MSTNNETLAKASKELMLREVFYGLFLMMLNKKWNTQVPTMGVSKNGINYQLIINDDFWGSLSPLHQIGLMKHEILHIAFFHLDKYFDFPDRDLANIAMDMEINQYIEEKYLPGADMTYADFDKKYNTIAQKLADDVTSGTISREDYSKEIRKIPPRGVYIKDYAELKLDEKAGTQYYYEKLQQAKNNKQDSADKGQDSKAGPKGNKKGTSGSKALDQMLDQMEKDQWVICDHDTWKEFEKMSEAEKRLMKSQTEFHLKEVADQVTKSRGTIPSELADMIEKLNFSEPPKFDWKGYLRRFTGGSTKIYTKKLHRKYNKRFDENPGLKIKPRRHVLVAVDTSGSVSKDELAEFFHEIHHIHKNGSDVTVLECDAAIAKITPYKRTNDSDKIKIHGRGGTDFQPVVDYFDENQHKYTCLIYFTDGEAPAPTTPRGRTLWVLSSTSQENLNLPGHTIKLN